MLKKRVLLYIYIGIAILFSSFTSFSQNTWDVHPFKERWSVGITAGNLLFYGDVAEFEYPWQKDLSEYKWAFGLVCRKDITPAIFLQGQGLNGTITGLRKKYSNGALANEQFKTSLYEYNICTKVNFYRLIKNKPTRFAIYGLGGIGMAHYRSQMKDLETDAIKRYVGYDANGKKTSMESNLVFPFGLGVGYAISEKINLNLDATYRYIDSDLLDSREGMTDVNDVYGYTSVGLVYKLGFKSPKPKPYDGGPDIIADDYDTEYTNDYDYTYDDEATVDSSGNIADNTVTTIDTETETYNDDVYNTVTDTSSNVNNYVPDNDYNDVVADNYDNNTNNTNTVSNDDNNSNNTVVDYNNDNNNTNTYTPPTTNYTDGLSYKVQIAASYNKPLSTNSLAQEYNIPQTISEDKIGNWYKYTVGDFKDKSDANSLRMKLTSQNGVKGAFIAPYNYGARIDNNEATALLNKRSSNNYSGTTSPSFMDPKTVVSTSTNPAIRNNAVFYAVQIAASRNPLSNSYLQSVADVTGPIYEDKVDGWYKYSVGVYGGFNEANELKRQLRGSKKVEGAFVVAYHNQKRIDAAQAQKIEGVGSSTGYTPSSNTYNNNYSSLSFNDASEIVNSSSNPSILQNKIYFSVQVAASKQKLPKEYFERRGIKEPMYSDYTDGWYKYSVGIFDNFKEANNYRKQIIRSNNIKGAFVAAYHYDKRIPQHEARKILRTK